MKTQLFLIKESFVFAWKALRSNILRTVLSLLGVAVGIFCIISVLSLVDSLENGIKGSFDMLGDDIIFIQKWPMSPEEGDEEYAWWRYMGRRQPSLKDQEQLEDQLTLAAAVSFQTSAMKTTEYKSNHLDNIFVSGVNYAYQDVIKLDISKGRYFTEMEAESGRNVGLIGHNIAEGLFPNDEPVGKTIKVGGSKVHVIGVFEKEGNSLLQNGFDQVVVLPAAFSSRLFDFDYADCSIIVKAKEGISNEQLKNEVISTLRPIRKLKPKQGDDFSVIESTMISGIIDAVFGATNQVGFFIGFFSILVGAFGIVNIMFVSVRERTPLIGIQKSLGARSSFILFQFLFESVFLCIIGGLIGLMFIFPLVAVLSSVTGMEFTISMANIIMGLSISALIGIVAGIIPALMASRLNPVDAMRS